MHHFRRFQSRRNVSYFWLSLKVTDLICVNYGMFSARTLGMLCLLGIGLGIGTIIIFHLLRHILKRKPTHPPSDDDDNDDKDENLGPVLPSDRPLENQDEASANSCSVNPNDSVRSFEVNRLCSLLVFS